MVKLLSLGLIVGHLLGIIWLAKLLDAATLSFWRIRRCRKPHLQHLVTLIHVTPLLKPEARPGQSVMVPFPDSV